MTLGQTDRALVAATWHFRANAERSATHRFRRLARELRETGASPVVVAMADDAVQDEIRHAAICDKLALSYGWDPAHEHEVEAPAPLGPPELPLVERLLFEMTAFCCFTESVNAAMLVETLKRTTARDIATALRTILKDEVKHSRMGWAHLQDMRARGCGGELHRCLPYLFATAGLDEVLAPDYRREDPALSEYGELDYKSRTQLLWAVLRDIFFPGLEAQGIPTEFGRRWLEERYADLPPL